MDLRSHRPAPSSGCHHPRKRDQVAAVPLRQHPLLATCLLPRLPAVGYDLWRADDSIVAQPCWRGKNFVASFH